MQIKYQGFFYAELLKISTDIHQSWKLTNLLVRSVEQQVSVRPPQRQTEAVQNVYSSQEEAEETHLFSALQPSLQPVWETPVFGTIVELVGSCHLACQVHQGQKSDCYCWQCPVYHINGNFVEVTLLVFDIWVYDISHKRIYKKENGKGHSSKYRASPSGEQLYGYVLNVPRRAQGTHVNGQEAKLAS